MPSWLAIARDVRSNDEIVNDPRDLTGVVADLGLSNLANLRRKAFETRHGCIVARAPKATSAQMFLLAASRGLTLIVALMSGRHDLH
jgi:hypothetical protein